MFGRIGNTPLPIVMITSDFKRFNLVFRTTLITCSVHLVLIQINLPQEEIPKILITQLEELPNREITQNINDRNKSC